MQEKQCSRCKKVLGVSLFATNPKTNQLYGMCRACRSAQAQYGKTESRKAALKRYNASERGRERTRKYKQSIKGKVADQRYYQSDKSKARDKRHRKRKSDLRQALARLDECMDSAFVRAMEAVFAAR